MLSRVDFAIPIGRFKIRGDIDYRIWISRLTEDSDQLAVRGARLARSWLAAHMMKRGVLVNYYWVPIDPFPLPTN